MKNNVIKALKIVVLVFITGLPFLKIYNYEIASPIVNEITGNEVEDFNYIQRSIWDNLPRVLNNDALGIIILILYELFVVFTILINIMFDERKPKLSKVCLHVSLGLIAILLFIGGLITM